MQNKKINRSSRELPESQFVRDVRAKPVRGAVVELAGTVQEARAGPRGRGRRGGGKGGTVGGPQPVPSKGDVAGAASWTAARHGRPASPRRAHHGRPLEGRIIADVPSKGASWTAGVTACRSLRPHLAVSACVRRQEEAVDHIHAGDNPKEVRIFSVFFVAVLLCSVGLLEDRGQESRTKRFSEELRSSGTCGLDCRMWFNVHNPRSDRLL